MLNLLTDLIQHHGIKAVNISLKPHGDSVAATLNLVPDPVAVPDEQMRTALIAPVVLIGEDAINGATATAIVEQVRQSIVGNAYFDSEAIKARIEQAKPKASAKASAEPTVKAKSAKASSAPATPPPPAAPAVDSLFSGDSL